MQPKHGHDSSRLTTRLHTHLMQRECPLFTIYQVACGSSCCEQPMKLLVVVAPCQGFDKAALARSQAPKQPTSKGLPAGQQQAYILAALKGQLPNSKVISLDRNTVVYDWRMYKYKTHTGACEFQQDIFCGALHVDLWSNWVWEEALQVAILIGCVVINPP